MILRRNKHYKLKAAVKKYTGEVLWTCIDRIEPPWDCGRYEFHEDEPEAYFLDFWIKDYKYTDG